MKSLKSAIIILISLISVFYTLTSNSLYIGTDLQWKNLLFKEGYGHNLFSSGLPQGNLYLGFSLNEFISLEVGHSSTFKRAKYVSVKTGEVVNGVVVPAMLSPVHFRTKAMLKGPHISVLIFYPLKDFNNFKLIGSLGVSYVKAAFERETISVCEPKILMSANRKMSAHHSVLRIGGGGQYMFNDYIGVRAILFFENSSQIHAKANDTTYYRMMPVTHLRDNFTSSVGLFYNF